MHILIKPKKVNIVSRSTLCHRFLETKELISTWPLDIGPDQVNLDSEYNKPMLPQRFVVGECRLFMNDFNFRCSFPPLTTSSVVSHNFSILVPGPKPSGFDIKRLIISNPNPTNEHCSESFYTHHCVLGTCKTLTLVAGMASVTKLVDVPQVPLGSAGLVVSAQGLGCMGMSSFYGPPKPDSEMIELIRYAIDLGVTFLDTSDAYGPHTNEVLIGKVWFRFSPVHLHGITITLQTKCQWRVWFDLQVKRLWSWCWVISGSEIGKDLRLFGEERHILFPWE